MKKIFIVLAAMVLMAITGCSPSGWGPVSSAKAITAFSFASPAATGLITEATHTIAITVPYGTDVTALVATFTKTGASVNVGSTVQISGTTPNDFTSSVVYTVTAADSSTQDYTVTVTVSSGDYTSANIGTLKYVPAGSFQRDSTSTNISTVSAFRMSQYEITRTQFSAIMGTDPSDTSYSSGMSDPVQMVTWYDAVEFCNMLSTAEGLTPVYTITDRVPSSGYPITNATVTPTWANNGYRLPTEMEWMWAAMGATSGSGYSSPTYLTGYGKLFAGSDSILANGSGGTHVIGDYAWTSENSSVNVMSQPVGTKLANELGLYDMSGNVWEWCWDWYDAYPAGTQADYRGAASGTIRVLRGGGWIHTASYATVADRDITHPLTHVAIGFRVVRP